MSKYLIIGGNSDIAIEFARILLKKNNEIILSSNDLEKLSLNVKKLESEFNTKINFLHLDIESLNSFDEIISHLDSDIKNLFFSNLTFVPLEKDLIDENLLTKKEKDYIFNYHLETYSRLSPYLNNKERKWLAKLF